MKEKKEDEKKDGQYDLVATWAVMPTWAKILVICLAIGIVLPLIIKIILAVWSTI